MNEQVVHYVVLRDQRNWEESIRRVGLEQQEDGTLTLARVSGTVDGKPIVVSNASVVEPSGLAVGDCRELYIADTKNDRIIRSDNLCSAQTILPGAGGSGDAPGQFSCPRGLLIANDCLYVADSGNARIQVFRLPSLELRLIWEGLFQEPIALASDNKGFVYVLDVKLNSILRFTKSGLPDDTYNGAVSQLFTGFKLISLAVDGNDTLYVTYVVDNDSNQIAYVNLAFNRLDAIEGDKPQHPGVMIARGHWLYVADQANGEIWVLDCTANIFLGALKDYRGPVTTLALDQAGTLYIKPGMDDAVHQLEANIAHVSSGYLTAGPFDAGADTVWERVHAELDLPDGTQAELHLFTADSSTALPTSWDNTTRAMALDTLIASLTTPRRYLWLHVTLESDDGRRSSPTLNQVQAETTTESYMNYLPAVYRRDDAPTHFLEHWLALFRSQLGDLEFALEDMPRRFDPATAPELDLRWLASWLAFEPPADFHGDELRELLLRVHELYERRGTPFGVREFVELYTDVRPALFESFRERHIWQLGYTSMLGFETALAAGLPDGMIVPGHTLADPQYFGLRGDYYSGIDFQAHVLSRTDQNVDFDWKFAKPDALAGTNYFSVRWTGQVRPRYSERFTFHVRADDGVRLWVDGVLVIDQWSERSVTEHSSVIAPELEAERWYSIQLEYYEKIQTESIRLAWSSRSQPKEIIPQSRLYSVRDETAQLELSPLEKEAGTVLVGQTVVGESGPLAKSDFGMPLFSETAHLFTISLPAASLPRPDQRELLQRIVEAEKPAHTDYHLCFVEPQMRVGFQARLGIDSIVAGPPAPLAMSGTTLGLDSYLGERPDDRQQSRVGKQAHLGKDTIVS